MIRRLWPHSLAAQVLLALALALLAAQLVNAVLIYRAQKQQAENQIAASAAVRITGAWDRMEAGRPLDRRRGRGGSRYALSRVSPVTSDMRRSSEVEKRLSEYLRSYGIAVRLVQVALPGGPPPVGHRRNGGLSRHDLTGRENDTARQAVLAAVRTPDGAWLSVLYAGPPARNSLNGVLLLQTAILYLVLLVPMMFVIRRVVRPIEALTQSVDAFRRQQRPVQLDLQGPSDMRQLTAAFNDMSSRIAAMIREKDVMLGAIGHDLKTPLAALRVRLESVDDEVQRTRMVAGVEDINRTLDDILTLARVGHSPGAPERVNLTALVATIAEEFADLSKDVTVENAARIVLPLHVTWMRRAIRNLISNAVRYGQRAEIALIAGDGTVIVRIDDSGPGIAESQIDAMFEPFARLENSRNQATGGSGLGLTLARAIAEQHGGSLKLTNRTEGGLRAEITLPVKN